ncbi:hypothetical protein GQ600_22054 [Phytophthora cactorum]|nr:hypothetical protein GQ600_22054 [Phytophthora cactorum]
MAWNRLLQAAVLSEPMESDLRQDTQFDFDDAEEDAQLDTMRTVVTAATAFKRGLSKASSTCGGFVKKTNERAEAAAKAVAAAVQGRPAVTAFGDRGDGGTGRVQRVAAEGRRHSQELEAALFHAAWPHPLLLQKRQWGVLRSFTVCHVVTLRTKRLCLEITTEVGASCWVASETQADRTVGLDTCTVPLRRKSERSMALTPRSGQRRLLSPPHRWPCRLRLPNPAASRTRFS